MSYSYYREKKTLTSLTNFKACLYIFSRSKENETSYIKLEKQCVDSVFSSV